MRARPQADAGSTHVLEAVIMATIMVSAVAYVATFETPPTTNSPTRDALQQRAQDALDGLYDIPVTGSSFGENALSVLLAQCLGGNCTNLTDKLGHMLPSGTSYAVYVSNGYDTFPVYEPSKPAGEAITATHLLEPKWSNSFVATGTTNVNPATDSLLTYSLPIFNSNTLSQGGSPLRVIVHGTRTSDGANYTLTGFFSTQALDKADKDLYPAASLYFVDATYNRTIASIDMSPWTWKYTQEPTYKNVTFTLRLNETAGIAIPAGTELTVSMPRGWTGAAVYDDNSPANWTLLANADDANSSATGSDIVARMNADLSNGYRDFKFRARFTGDVFDWYSFHAHLSKGALSEANLLVRGARSQSHSAFAVPQVAMSVPRPMGATATTTWTLVVDVPDKADESVSVSMPTVAVRTTKSDLNAKTATSEPVSSEDAQDVEVRPTIVINSIEVIEQDGAPIFGGMKAVSGGGQWNVTPTRLMWTGAHLNVDGPLSLVFEVTASGTAGAGTSKNPFVPPAQFDSYKGRMFQQVGPGFYRGVFLPEAYNGSLSLKYQGYRSPQSAGMGLQHVFASDSIYKTTLLPGKTNYTLNPLPSFQDSIHGSYVHVEQRSVPVGKDVVMSADVESLLFALAQAGISAGVNLHIYPPWSGDARTPIWSEENLDAGILGSDVTSMMLLEMNGDAFLDVVVGTSNGRVLALDGLTGARIQGRVFVADLAATATNDSVTSITHLVPYEYKGETYIVAVTDSEGEAMYVLDKQYRKKWSFSKPNDNILSIDTSVDITGEGDKDIIIGREDGGIFVLHPPKDSKKTSLDWVKSADPDSTIEGAFYTSLGPPRALVGLHRTGTAGDKSGFAVSFQSTPMLWYEVDWGNPILGDTSFGVTSLPRAGFQSVTNESMRAWTFFGSPINTARPYDYDRDGVTDLIAGSPAGYVYAMNGRVATQPLYSQVHYPMQAIRDADARDPFNAVFLTEDGQARITTTGWNDYTCAYCSLVMPIPSQTFPHANAIALNASHSFWVVGDDNTLMRSVPGPDSPGGKDDPRFPQLQIVPARGTKDGIDYFGFEKVSESELGVLEAGGTYARTHDFKDVWFRWMPENDVGFVIGGPCKIILDPSCEEALLMRTTDGGKSWEVYGNGQTAQDGESRFQNVHGTQVNVGLTRINFTTHDVGWIVGEAGTLLRTLDGGESWHGVETPTTEPLLDISCDPLDPGFCILVSAKYAWRTERGIEKDRFDMRWESLDIDLVSATADQDVNPKNDAVHDDVEQRVDEPVEEKELEESRRIQERALKSVGVVSREVAYIGAENAVFKTLDGGENWTTLPMNYLEADANRISAFADGRGYIFGGNASHARVFFLHDYDMASRAQTVNLLTLAEGERIVQVDLDTDYSYYQTSAFAEFWASTDGGKNWQSLGSMGRTGAVREAGGGLSTYVQTEAFRGHFEGEENLGETLKLRVDFRTQGDMTLLSAQVRRLEGKVTVLLPDDKTTREEPFAVDLRDPAFIDPQATTAVWDIVEGVIHQPIVPEYWTRNVSGEVRDVQTGYTVSGDWRPEVWVATGGVLAANSPEHMAYAGTDLDKYVKNDNRIYLLDGRNGSVIARTGSFTGNVTSLRLSDADGDLKPELLYATTWDPANKNGTLVGLDPSTLQLLWRVYLDLNQPSGLLANKDAAGNGAAIVGTRASEKGQSAIPGRVYSHRDDDGAPNWGAIPDQQGRYIITKTIPPRWLFGPYVVEVEVKWSNDVQEEAESGLKTKRVLQTARFYDYFLVTPPAALAPPSPVYQVHLVTWMKDWR